MRLLSVFLFLFIGLFTNGNEYHVSEKGNNKSIGSKELPFRTISHAAEIALAGDVVIVHAGIYRKQVNPLNGGEFDVKRIVYKAADGERVEIKGSEIIVGWKLESNKLWKVSI